MFLKFAKQFSNCVSKNRFAIGCSTGGIGGFYVGRKLHDESISSNYNCNTFFCFFPLVLGCSVFGSLLGGIVAGTAEILIPGSLATYGIYKYDKYILKNKNENDNKNDVN